MACIVILEDHAPLRRGMAAALRDLEHQIVEMGTAEEARRWLDVEIPDLLVLDLVLPGEGGLDLLRHLREAPRTRHLPVLVVSGQERVQDRVVGLKTGADDYLVKPFDLQEFCARVETLLRRVSPHWPLVEKEEGFFQSGELLVDCLDRRLWTGLRWVSLTPLEFQLLWAFLQSPQVPHTQEDLLRMVWNQPFGTGNPSLVRWAIKQLRNKIEEDPGAPRLLVTRPRGGYVYEGPPLQPSEEVDRAEPLQMAPDLAVSLVTRLPVGVLVLDPQGRCVFWNRPAADLLGYARQDVLGARLPRTLLSPQNAGVWDRVENLLRGKGSEAGAFSVQCRRKDRSVVTVLLTLFAVSMHQKNYVAGMFAPLSGALEGGVDEAPGESERIP